MKVILVSGRTSKQGTSLEVGKTSDEYFDNVAVIEMNEDDIKEIGAKESKPVEVSTKFGSTVVRCKKSNLDRGIAFMPYGPWINMITEGDTRGTGMANLKDLEAEISATGKNVPTIVEIVKLMREH